MSPTKRIEKLTPEQEAELPAHRERWRAIGLSTEPVEPEKVREAVRALYRAGSAAEPAAVIVLSSPMACLIARATVQALMRKNPSENQRQVLEKKLRDQLWGQLRDQLWGQLSAQVGAQLWGGQLWGQLCGQLRAQLRNQLRDQLSAQVGAQLWGGQLRAQLRDQLWGQLSAQLGDQLWGQLSAQVGAQLWGRLGNQLRDQLWGQLGNQLGDQLGDQLRAQLWDQQIYESTYFWGGQDGYWLAWAEFGQRIGVQIGSQTAAHFDAYKAYAQSAGWMYAYAGMAFVSDRPAELHFDENRRLHQADGMAVEFRDGWGVYSWHGLRMPAWPWEQPAELTPDRIRKEANQETKRALIGLYDHRGGEGAFIRDSGAELVHEDKWGKLWRTPIGEDEPYMAVEVINSTPEPDGSEKRYFLRVHPELRPIPDVLDGEREYGAPQELTALNAVASTFGMTGDRYRVWAES